MKLTQLFYSYLDLLFVHFYDYTTSIPELMHSLNDEVRSGRVNYLGISDSPGKIKPDQHFGSSKEANYLFLAQPGSSAGPTSMQEATDWQSL